MCARAASGCGCRRWWMRRAVGRVSMWRGATARTSIKADGEPVGSASKQASRLPVLAWLPDSAKLFTDAPKLRRHWLNWSLFHVKPQFLDVWKAYHRALRQRNALLRLARSADADMLFWEQRLCAEAAVIDRLRGEYLSELSEQWSPIARRLSGLDACLSYRRGWEDDTALGDSLRARRALDRRRGCTSSGPHRADVAFQADGGRGHRLPFQGADEIVWNGLAVWPSAVHG